MLNFVPNYAGKPSPVARSRSIPGIQPPGKLSPQGLQEIIFVQPDQAQGKCLLPDGELYLFIHNFFPGIQHTNKTFRTPLYLEGDNIIIRYDDRAYVEIMRRHRSNDKAGRIGE